MFRRAPSLCIRAAGRGSPAPAQAARPALPLGPAGARLHEEGCVLLYNELTLLMCWFSLFSASVGIWNRCVKDGVDIKPKAPDGTLIPNTYRSSFSCVSAGALRRISTDLPTHPPRQVFKELNRLKLYRRFADSCASEELPVDKERYEQDAWDEQLSRSCCTSQHRADSRIPGASRTAPRLTCR